MKFRNQFLKYQLHCEGDDGGEGGGGGGNENNQQQQNQNQQQNGNDNNQNNSQNNESDFSGMWQTEDSSSDNNNQQQQQQTQQQQQAPSAEDVFNAHVDTLGFGSDANDMLAAMQSQDPEAMAKAVANLQTSTYRAAMVDVNKLVNTRVDAAMQESSQNVNNTIEANSIVAQMETALPWTKQPAYAPMAKAVVNQMLQKPGMTPEKAIAETSKYFQQFATDATKGMQKAPNGKPIGGFQNQQSNQQQNDDQSDTPDWIDFLGGKPD